MKKVLLVIMTAFLLVSCWKLDPPDSEPKKLPPRSGAFDTVHVYGPLKVWSVAEKQYITTWGKVRDSLIPTPEYLVTMNGEQVEKYAKESGQRWNLLLGISILIGTFIVFWLLTRSDKIKDAAKNVIRGVGVAVGIALGVMASKPANIAQLNSKTVHEKQLKHYLKIDPELNYFWDSIFNNKKMITR